MNNKVQAILVGGPQDGQTILIDEAYPEVIIAARVMERTGQFKEVFRSKYKLSSHGPSIRYEFDDSN